MVGADTRKEILETVDLCEPFCEQSGKMINVIVIFSFQLKSRNLPEIKIEMPSATETKTGIIPFKKGTIKENNNLHFHNLILTRYSA